MSTLKEKADEILAEKEEKIIPENIKSGVTIFDVTGTYSGGGSDVLAYNSEQEMREDTSASEGSTALVYPTYSDYRNRISFDTILYNIDFSASGSVDLEFVKGIINEYGEENNYSGTITFENQENGAYLIVSISLTIDSDEASNEVVSVLLNFTYGNSSPTTSETLIAHYYGIGNSTQGDEFITITNSNGSSFYELADFGGEGMRYNLDASEDFYLFDDILGAVCGVKDFTSSSNVYTKSCKEWKRVSTPEWDGIYRSIADGNRHNTNLIGTVMLMSSKFSLTITDFIEAYDAGESGQEEYEIQFKLRKNDNQIPSHIDDVKISFNIKGRDGVLIGNVNNSSGSYISIDFDASGFAYEQYLGTMSGDVITSQMFKEGYSVSDLVITYTTEETE